MEDLVCQPLDATLAYSLAFFLIPARWSHGLEEAGGAPLTSKAREGERYEGFAADWRGDELITNGNYQLYKPGWTGPALTSLGGIGLCNSENVGDIPTDTPHSYHGMGSPTLLTGTVSILLNTTPAV